MGLHVDCGEVLRRYMRLGQRLHASSNSYCALKYFTLRPRSRIEWLYRVASSAFKEATSTFPWLYGPAASVPLFTQIYATYLRLQTLFTPHTLSAELSDDTP